MTSSSWNQFINQFLLEFGWIDWKVDLSMLQLIENKTQMTNLKTTNRGKAESCGICLLEAQFTLKVRMKGFILTPYFQNGFFRQTKCRVWRVPNITSYCSSGKILSSLRLFWDLVWMLQWNHFFSSACPDELRQDRGHKQEHDQTAQSFGWLQVENSRLSFLSSLAYLNAASSPKMEHECIIQNRFFSPIFSIPPF